MSVAKTFLTNLAILITCAYLFNLGYKYLFARMSARSRQSVMIAIFILSGWLAMLLGVQLYETAIFDLRVVPIIFSALVFRDIRLPALIGTGIALGRLALDGLSAASLASALTVFMLGWIASGLVLLFVHKAWRFGVKATVAVVVINTAQTALIAIVSIVPPVEYLTQIAVITYPLAIALCSFFVFIINDFYKDLRRSDELRNMNLLLRRQTRELREAKRELEHKARQLLLASRYKSEFMANMSHELKTPLNSIILLSQLVRDNEEQTYAAEDQRYAELIHTAGNDLLQLINDILDLSKVEAGKMDIACEPVAIGEAVTLLGHQFAPVAEQKGLTFTFTVADDVPAAIMSDGLRINQILRNLLANAFKFTEEGGVELRVSRERAEGLPAGRDGRQGAPASASGEPGERRPVRAILRAGREPAVQADGRSASGLRRHGRFADRRQRERMRLRQVATEARRAAAPAVVPRDWVVFTVSDTGIGIDPDKRELIFEAFQQEDGAINRKYGGTGLGLSISLQLARLLGGSLSLFGEKGSGSTFQLRLPLKPVADAAEEGG